MTSPGEYTGKSRSVEWYTPMHIVESARAVLGAIDLDPASTTEANQCVQATEIFTERDDGLARPWRGRVFCNPPYGCEVSKWVEKFLAEYEDEHMSAGVMLLNASTDTEWAQELMMWGSVCFVRGRLRFWNPQFESNNPTQGSMIAYLGDNHPMFIVIFGELGFAYEAA